MDREDGTTSGTGLRENHAAVMLDDLLDVCQPQPGSLGSGGKEGPE